MNEAEVLHFHAKLWDAARKSGANTDNHGNVIPFVWAYKINSHGLTIYFVLHYQQNHRKS